MGKKKKIMIRGKEHLVIRDYMKDGYHCIEFKHPDNSRENILEILRILEHVDMIRVMDDGNCWLSCDRFVRWNPLTYIFIFILGIIGFFISGIEGLSESGGPFMENWFGEYTYKKDEVEIINE